MKTSTIILSLLLCVLCSFSQAAEKKRNILFILVDDQRWDALSCLGHSFLKTPAADSLAANGVRFANAFVTTSLKLGDLSLQDIDGLLPVARLFVARLHKRSTVETTSLWGRLYV